MFKQNYFYFIVSIIALSHCAFVLIVHPDTVPTWFIRVLGGYFVVLLIDYILKMYSFYLDKKIERLKKQIENLDSPK